MGVAARDNAVPALISAVSSTRASGVNLQAGSQVQYLQAGRISANYLDVLAVRPIIGRNFSADEDRPHGPDTAILSYGVWQKTFGADNNILGRSILLKGEPYTVIGVLPEGATTPLNADLYTAIQASRDGEGGGTNFLPPSRGFATAQPGRRRMPRSIVPGPTAPNATSYVENFRRTGLVLFRAPAEG